MKARKVATRPFAPKPFHPGDWVRFTPRDELTNAERPGGPLVGQVWARDWRPRAFSVLVEGTPQPYIVREMYAESLGTSRGVEALTLL